MTVDWYVKIETPDIDENHPGIYEWRIERVGVYIGKSKRLTARLREYPNNVRKLVENLPYRRHNPKGFRAVHHHLKAALDRGQPVKLTVLENCSLELLNKQERFWIDLRRQEAASGGLPVLNSN